MITVLTLCSANYLAHAKTLGESLAGQNPDFHFVIGLVDRIPGTLSSKLWEPFELLPVETIGLEGFQELARRYNLVELNTAVKPFYIEHLYRRNPAVEQVIYLDPDILVTASLDPVVEQLRQHDLMLTPHSCTFNNTPDNLHYELAMLQTGVYNLGFLGTSRSDETFKFLKWWQQRLREYCYYKPGSGMFVDQIWATLAPLYFPRTLVEKNPGYNMSYWNLFERTLGREQECYVVNGTSPLVFYHFSSYKPEKSEIIASRGGQPLVSFDKRPDLRPIFEEYKARLLSNGYAEARLLPCCFGPQPPTSFERKKMAIKTFARECSRNVLGLIPGAGRRSVKRLAQFIANSCAI